MHHDGFRVEKPSGLPATGQREGGVRTTVQESQIVGQPSEPWPVSVIADRVVNAHASLLGGHDMNFPSPSRGWPSKSTVLMIKGRHEQHPSEDGRV